MNSSALQLPNKTTLELHLELKLSIDVVLHTWLKFSKLLF
jgi:hypothetical protein